MRLERARGSRCGEPFPVYRDLAAHLLSAHATDGRDPIVAQVLATCAGYSYADLDTVATMMARLGLEDCACVEIQQIVDAMFIYSTAFLVQSRCGRVVILCYRGTEPTNLTNWLTDADVAPESITLSTPGGPHRFEVHGGFYRNARATRLEVARELQLATEGRSLADPDVRTKHPLEALYVTGHSLGGAMAVLFALTTPQERLRAIYTFGQPMVVCGPLPSDSEAVGGRLFRHVGPRDPVPALPPAGWGEFEHIGREYRYVEGTWTQAAEPMEQMKSVREIPRSVLALLTGSSRSDSSRYTLDAHGPHRYLDALRAPGRVTELGD